MSKITGQVTRFGVYTNDGVTLIGLAEVKLPEIKRKAVTLGGAGILGEIELPSPTQIESMETELKFNSLNPDGLKLWSINGGPLTLRSFINELDGNHRIIEGGWRVALKGNTTSVDLGTVKQDELTNTTVKYSTTFLEIFYEGKSLLKIDKINGIVEQLGISLIKNLMDIG